MRSLLLSVLCVLLLVVAEGNVTKPYFEEHIDGVKLVEVANFSLPNFSFHKNDTDRDLNSTYLQGVDSADEEHLEVNNVSDEPELDLDDGFNGEVHIESFLNAFLPWEASLDDCVDIDNPQCSIVFASFTLLDRILLSPEMTLFLDQHFNVRNELLVPEEVSGIEEETKVRTLCRFQTRHSYHCFAGT